MAKPIPLTIWDRGRRKVHRDWMDDGKSHYESEPRRSPTQWLESQPIFDWFVAALQRSRWSARKIQPFIEKHHIDMSEFERVDYRSYNDFFIRKFRPGVRSFPARGGQMGAFAEARYFGWTSVAPHQRFPIKGHSLCADDIMGDAALARAFAGGPVLLARLAPVDYHRIHYPDDGKTSYSDRIGGRLWTINWRALQNKPDILFRNERHVQILDTEHFGRLGFVEIGAMTVGRVVQTHPLDQPFGRGDEKGYFCFGGSAIVVFGEPGAWRPAADILRNTPEAIETYLKLGEPVAELVSDPGMQKPQQMAS
jgi:phosphatidylserine decarboxylase